eukprot:gene728-136_t
MSGIIKHEKRPQDYIQNLRFKSTLAQIEKDYEKKMAELEKSMAELKKKKDDDIWAIKKQQKDCELQQKKRRLSQRAEEQLKCNVDKMVAYAESRIECETKKGKFRWHGNSWGHGMHSISTSELASAVQAEFRRKGFKKCTVTLEKLLLGNALNFKNFEWDDAAAKAVEGKEIVGQCPVCLDDKKSLKAFVDCGHTHCAGCAEDFVGKPCPVCRTPVTRAISIFTN